MSKRERKLCYVELNLFLNLKKINIYVVDEEKMIHCSWNYMKYFFYPVYIVIDGSGQNFYQNSTVTLLANQPK